MVELKKSSWVICSIVRDASKGLKVNIPIINSFLNHISEYKIVVFENDSKDNSKELLQEWGNEIGKDNFHLFMENRNVKNTIPDKKEVDFVNQYYSSIRISKMVNLRNQYLEYIEIQNWNADFLMIVDLDVAGLSLKGILSVFNNDKEWDAVTANGYSLSPSLRKRYHDSYALTECGDENEPQTEKKISELSKKYGSLKENDEWIKVYSAFGGLSMYRFDSIKKMRYLLTYNNDSRVEVKCEHFTLYDQMVIRGYDQIFIVPSLILKYQNITFSLIRKFVKNLLR